MSDTSIVSDQGLMTLQTLHKKAKSMEGWKNTPMSRWTEHLSLSDLDLALADSATLQTHEEVLQGHLHHDLHLKSSSSSGLETRSIRVKENEVFEWDETINGSSAGIRHVHLYLEPGAQMLARRSMTSGLWKERWFVHLEKGAQFNLQIAAHLKGRDVCEITTHVTHQAEGAASQSECFFALEDQSYASFIADLFILPGVKKSGAVQLAKALHLDRTVQSYLRPWMKIGNDDVTASHGAASGPLPSEQMQYLTQRGIALHDIKKILATAFVTQAFQKLSSLSPAEALIQHLQGNRHDH